MCITNLLLSLILLLVASSAHAQTANTTIYGANLACPQDNPICNPPPQTLVALCNQFVVGVNCPRTFHPSWVNVLRFWGSSGANCVTSSDGGANWALCASQPFAEPIVQVASSTDGSVIAVTSVAGICTIKQSIDNAVSWSTRFTDANNCAPTLSASQMVRCQVTSGRCDYMFVEGADRTRTYRSDDNGSTWTQTNVLDSLIVSANSSSFDGNAGLLGGIINNNRKSVFSSGGDWSVSSGWPAPASNYGTTTASLKNSLPIGYTVNLSTLIYHQLDENGNVTATFLPVGADTGNVSLSVLQYSSSIFYMVGFKAGGQAFWISTNNLVTNSLLAENAANGGLATLYNVGGVIYISVSGTVGAFYRIT